jgi:hypothetical protein
LSPLTKILIVLLTIASIFLCGIVVTYVANADNFRQKYNDMKRAADAAEARKQSAEAELNEKKAEFQRIQDKLSSDLTTLQSEITQLRNNLGTAESDNALLVRKLENWTAVLNDFRETNQNQQKLLEDTIEELKVVKTERIELRDKLDQTTQSLLQRMAVIETLEADKKRLLEDKTELQKRLDRVLLPLGEASTLPVPPTPEKDVARPTAPLPRMEPTKPLELKGLVTNVDLKNKMAGISIGAADGVKEGMKFHVTRGSDFICDVIILDVGDDEAVGFLDLIQQQPRAGDNVATNL